MKKIRFLKLKKFKRKSGTLIPINFNKKFPIKVKRIFYIYAKKNSARGDHAHKKLTQIFIPIFGTTKLIVTKNGLEKNYILDCKKNKAILVPPMIWCRLEFIKKNSIILVACNDTYKFSDYIETLKEFKNLEKKI